MSQWSRMVRVMAGALLVVLVPLAASASAPLLNTSALPVDSRGDSEGETGSPLALSAGGIPEPPFGPQPVCGTARVVGASTPPVGAVRVPAGDNSAIDLSRKNTVYWFAPGTHTVTGRDFFARAGAGSTYLGAPGAVLEGLKQIPFAFVGGAAGVRVQHLTIRNFGVEGGNKNVAAVNRDGGDGWIVRGNTITQNAGAGVRAGSNSVTADNCLSDNGQLGLMSYDGDAGVFNISVTGNEIVGNNRDDWSRREPGCGCAAGAKFWNTENAKVEGNYVHSNRATGLWADTNNRGFRFANNYISDNDSFGIMYEISYNAQIVDNVLERNGLVRGPTDPAFPTSAIYISESGSDPRVSTAYSSVFMIERNYMANNWSGVTLWEDSARFCSSPANPSKSYCTLVNPRANLNACRNASPNSAIAWDCRWRTQRVRVVDNVFISQQSVLGPQCTPARGCGFNAVMAGGSRFGVNSPLVPEDIQKSLVSNQGNVFTDNRYWGNWQFMGPRQGVAVSLELWPEVAGTGGTK